MNASTTMERAQAYLRLHLTRRGPEVVPQTVGPFVTISRESGTGGSALAHELATHLSRHEVTHPWELYSANLIEEMLRANHLSPSLARFLPEDRLSHVDASVGEILGLHPDLWELVRKTNDLLRHLAQAGNVILIGRGANFATAGIARGVHVRLVASETHRTATTAHWLSIDAASAQRHNARRDAARRRYVRANFDADVTAPVAYDLVLNVERIPSPVAVEMIAALVDSRRDPIAKPHPPNLLDRIAHAVA